MNIPERAQEILAKLGVDLADFAGGDIPSRTPITGETIEYLRANTIQEARHTIGIAQGAFYFWRLVPAPKRGEVVRAFGEMLRVYKKELGELISIEAGKILSEGEGEVQEAIDICDFAVGLSRQLHGLTIASERPDHRMMETWHPLGVCGIITAFNFPAAVWAWNAAIALVCGNTIVWKPSEKTTLTALACQSLFQKTLEMFPYISKYISSLLLGDSKIGSEIAGNDLVKIVSATGSTRMGSLVGPKVAARFGRSILELGGNNAAIVTPSADLDLAIRAIVFSAVGTAGQRCTSLRRLIVHESIFNAVTEKLHQVYSSLRIGSPLDNDTLVGPLIDSAAYDTMQNVLLEAENDGAIVIGGERVLEEDYPNAYYVMPAICQARRHLAVARQETFAPILHVMPYHDLDYAIKMNNDVPQGLSSSIFTTDLREAEYFLSAAGSDCGIANVNIGPSGAEIGGAFGGEKDTGGGRESGSDSWKAYMRRATNTINYSNELPLAQGVKFDI